MFWENFDRICRSRGTTPSGACVAVGIGKNRPTNWKKTGALPKQDEMELLANYLACNVADFFTDRTHRTYEQMVEEQLATGEWEVAEHEGLDERELEFISVYSLCSKRQRAELMLKVYEFADENGISY